MRDILNSERRRCRWLAVLVSALLPAAMGQPIAAPASAYPEPPQALFKDLFVAVQTTPIFADSKEFPDAIPNTAPDDILGQYHALDFIRRRPSNTSSKRTLCCPCRPLRCVRRAIQFPS